MLDVKKIAFLCHPYHRGGVTRWMADAAIALAKQGHEVYFITVEPGKEFFSAKGRETLLQLLGKNANTVKIIKTGVGYEFEFGTPGYRAWVYKKLIAALPAGTPIILSDDHAVWEAAVSLHQSYPVVGVLHADESQYYNLAEKYYREVAVFACVSERVKATMQKRVPEFDPGCMYTIPCGINLPAFELAGHREDLLQLIFVGRISEYQKRAGDLLKIAIQLAKKGKNFRLNIIGDGPEKTALENKVKEAGLQQYVVFPGWLSQKEVARYLSASDILLLTSDFEGTPIAMMEALAAGCGMVGTRVSGIEDYEHHPLAADCLRVYTVGDIEEALNKIEAISAIPQNVRQQAARKLAETEFSMEVCLSRYLVALAAIRANINPIPAISIGLSQLLYSKMIALARHMKVRLLMR